MSWNVTFKLSWDTSVAPARETKTSEPTQFQRICSMLGVELILAHSPQAKGRVERAFKTLQGRWTKEFRVLGITTVAEANARLPELIAEYNREFSIAPADEEDSYIRLSDEEKMSWNSSLELGTEGRSAAT